MIFQHDRYCPVAVECRPSFLYAGRVGLRDFLPHFTFADSGISPSLYFHYIGVVVAIKKRKERKNGIIGFARFSADLSTVPLCENGNARFCWLEGGVIIVTSLWPAIILRLGLNESFHLSLVSFFLVQFFVAHVWPVTSSLDRLRGVARKQVCERESEFGATRPLLSCFLLRSSEFNIPRNLLSKCGKK